MSEIFFIADMHLNHRKMVKPDPLTGVRYRDFSSLEEMNETIISNINNVVRPKDKLYILGDVVFQPATSEHLLARINGKKRLILGNHDEIKPNSYYSKYFDEIMLWKLFQDWDFVVTHIPLHPECFRDMALNVHGHLHRTKLLDHRYMNICVERTGYGPTHADILIDNAKVLRDSMNFARTLAEEYASLPCGEIVLQEKHNTTIETYDLKKVFSKYEDL